MLFNSWEFLILLLITLVLYYLPLTGSVRRIWQVMLLLVSSAIFYAWEEPRLLLLLFSSCIVNAIAVERILFHKSREQGDAGREVEPGTATSPCDFTETRVSKARLWLFWTVALNLLFLAFFKYAGFLAGLLPETPLTESLKHWFAGIPLPVGISFYTFQGISLVVDVWRSDISEQTAERLSGRGHRRISSVRDTSFYIAFFPQLVAGPIVKAHEFIDQIGSKMIRDIDWKTVRRGLVLGYFLKVFVADNLAENTVRLSTGGAELADWGPIGLGSLLYGYSLQIFADFAGYSLIAIGLGALFGYHLPENFRFPYLSTSITEFWRRWHLSLSSWLRDYLYIPLGGNRKGTGRTYFNLFLVMFLGGLWHGAAWKFAIWGSLHGIFLALERLMGARRSRHGEASQRGAAKSMETRAWRREPEGGSQEHGAGLESHDGSGSASHARVSRLASFCLPLKTMLAWLFTFHLVTLLWLTFMMPDVASIKAFFVGLTSGHMGFSGPPIFSLLFYGSAVVLYHGWGWIREHRELLAKKLLRSPIEPLVHGLLVFVVITNPGAPRGFIYFQF
jgi:alginate O-acetyltransferase complex protein AlgI